MGVYRSGNFQHDMKPDLKNTIQTRLDMILGQNKSICLNTKKKQVRSRSKTDYAKCKYCGVSFRFESFFGTNNFMRHYAKCNKRINSDVDQMIISKGNEGYTFRSIKYDLGILLKLIFLRCI